MSNNVTKTDPPSSGGVDVKNSVQNEENVAHPGQAASKSDYPNLATAGDSTTNTSTSLKGSSAEPGTTVDPDGVGLKSVRKQDGPAH